MSLMRAKSVVALSLATIMAATPTMGIAAARPPAPINPFAVVAAFGSPAAATALCGNTTASAATAAAATMQAAAPGCVLPVVDMAAAPTVDGAPVAPMGYAVNNNSIYPALIVIAGLAAGALLFSTLGDDSDDDDDDFVPVSPA